jgi:choline dehydrogenase-like flavoprotein
MNLDTSMECLPDDAERGEWDVIVVGTGMGGGTVGYELARRGRRVLFVEKGRFLHASDAPARPRDGSVLEERLSTGWWPLPLEGETKFGKIHFWAPIGAGSGGTTTNFGAQLERLKPPDFAPRANFPDVTDSMLPEQWPISYDELVPSYRRAEALYGVCGTEDPLYPDPAASLREPPPLSERDQVLRDSLVSFGLNPYRSHVAFHNVPNCDECFLRCFRGCKGDAGRRALLPALTQHGARILPDCEVRGLTADRHRVTGIIAVTRDGHEIRLSAKIVVLAAGSLMTPILLLKSRSLEWPDGIANRSGHVGRNLMLHVSDFLTIDHREFHPAGRPYKSLALNDFYMEGGKKFGTLQAVGVPMRAEGIEVYLRGEARKNPSWWRDRLSRFNALAARLMVRHFRRASFWATIVEDLPYPENRVVPDGTKMDGRRFAYSYPRELYDRNRLYRRRLKERLAPRHKVTIVTGGRDNTNYSHACGTCRFGDDPKTSVLDRTNRAHDLENLYVVDASFFPSSGGMNPSLTIAANALRVGGIIDDQLG